MNFKRNKFLIALFLLGSSMLSTKGYATTFYDSYSGQSQSGEFGVGYYTPANVFTSSASGKVTDIKLSLVTSDPRSPSTTFTESIFAWNGTVGTLLQSESVNVEYGYSGLVDFTNVVGLSLTAGSKYYLSVAANTLYNGWWSYGISQNVPYYENGESTPFGTYTTGGAIISGAVPEAEAWAMMLLGLPLLGWSMRTKSTRNSD